MFGDVIGPIISWVALLALTYVTWKHRGRKGDTATGHQGLCLSSLANLLGRPASDVLSENPFRKWEYVKSRERDLAEPVFDLVFANDGIDFICDGDERVHTLFLYNEGGRHFKEGLVDLPFASTRQDVIRRLGNPVKSGAALNYKDIGPQGAWDRFVRPGYTVHVQYLPGVDRIGKITLMRADVVP